jgi:hypothetical protein
MRSGLLTARLRLYSKKILPFLISISATMKGEAPMRELASKVLQPGTFWQSLQFIHLTAVQDARGEAACVFPVVTRLGAAVPVAKTTGSIWP